MLKSTETVDIKRFSIPWKLASYVVLDPSIRELSEGKTIIGRLTKQGSSLWLRCWIFVQCALIGIKNMMLILLE
jgi:hypothetical protein